MKTPESDARSERRALLLLSLVLVACSRESAFDAAFGTLTATRATPAMEPSECPSSPSPRRPREPRSCILLRASRREGKLEAKND